MSHDTGSNQSIKEAVINVVTNEKGRAIPPGIVVGKLTAQFAKSFTKNDIYQAIDQLVQAGTLKQLAKTKYLVLGYLNAPVDHSKLLEGIININSSNSGFITIDGETKAQYFVFRTNLNGALNGDRVQFALMQKAPKADLLDAVVTKVMAHSKDFYVGIFTLNADKTYDIKIDDEKFYLKVFLDSIEGLVSGQKILIKIKTYEKTAAYGTVSRILGHKDDVGVDILSIVYDNGVEPDFPDSVIEYAKAITLNIDDEQRRIRKDLTKLPIVTIDPKTSKDFDDAIYVDTLDNDQFFLSVSIADVSHYVRFQSTLDEEALKRGCSIYLTDRVIPMLPHNLSDDICSLNPNVERLTLTCDMVIRRDGSIKDIEVYPSIIKSHRRFSYDEVNEYFNKTSTLPKDTLEVKTMLDKALSLHHILDINKKQRGYINFEIPEPLIVINDKGVPVEIKKRESGTAQRMIEDFMVAANEAVTIYANKQK
jgi:ribonuclease R